MANISATNSKNLSSNAGGSFKITAFFEEIGTNDNFSQLQVKATISRNNGGFEVGSGGTLKLYWHDNKTNADTLLGSLVVAQLSSNYPTAKNITKTIEVEHLDDGTLSGYAKVTWTKNRDYDYIPNSGNVSTANTALTTIEQGTLRINVNGTYLKAKAYIGVNGEWKLCSAYIGKNGNWLKGS